MFIFLEGKDMSTFNKVYRHLCLFFLFLVFSCNCFSGQSERKHESITHISSKEKSSYQLSLDDVHPTSNSIFITQSSDKSVPKGEPIVIRVTGYSAFESEKDTKSEAKRLLALRASKMDAYRALAERIYGLSVSGKSMMKDYVLKEDNFAVGFNSFIQGARVVSVNEKKDIGFETVLELLLPSDFGDCFNKVNNFKNGMNCLRPLPNTSLFLDEENKGNLPSNSSRYPRDRHHSTGYFLN
jgi:hypothetical protein